jgi:hypothetical protein
MSVAALSTPGFSQYIAASSNVSASQKAFQSLQQNLASGNLTAAQSAFNTYQQLNQTPSAASGNSSSAASQFSADLTALGKAIGSGNLSTAQSAFATLQSALQTTPSQAITNAESAAAQTVQWVDDLLNLSDSNPAPTTPTAAILDSAYGINPSPTTNPTVALLDNAYNVGGAGSTSTSGTTPSNGAVATPLSTPAGTPTPSIVSAGNAGSGATVNAYA